MLQELQKTAAPEAELLGDLTPLLEQIGSPEGLAALAGARDPLASPPARTVAGLKTFLEEYHSRILQPVELPAIQRAFAHTGSNQLRELIAFDQALGLETKEFATASRIVGLTQLQRLRPLRDHRLVQRYLAAVEEGAANGWHTLVYGLTLAVYFLPLRQGLIGYAKRTTRGFIQSAARSLDLTRADSEEILGEFSARFPAAVEALLPGAIVV
jgi:urease accessory protein UreF